MKKKICFVAQFPPPIHGLSKAVETLYTSSLSNDFELEKIDITNNKFFLHSIFLIYKSNADLFYFTISQSIGGNIRDLIILRLFLIKKKKILVHLHGGYYRHLVDKEMSSWQRKANFKAISKIDGAIVLGPSLKWIFQDMLPKNKIFTVPNCVDDEFLMTDEEFELKINRVNNEAIHHVLWLSNFIKSKGYPVVLEMAKLEKERVTIGGRKKFHFDFAGKFFDKKEEEFFWNYVNLYNLEGFITYHGIVTGEKKRNLLNNSTFFALPTRYTNEGQPISILEAMGNGMAVLTTDHAGIKDIVDIQNSGFISDSSTDIYDYIRKVHNLESILRYNRTKILKNYCQNKYIESMGEVFRRVSDGVDI